MCSISYFFQPHRKLAVNFDRMLLLNVYSNSFIFGTPYKGCQLLTLSRNAREESDGSFTVYVKN